MMAASLKILANVTGLELIFLVSFTEIKLNIPDQGLLNIVTSKSKTLSLVVDGLSESTTSKAKPEGSRYTQMLECNHLECGKRGRN
jgi:hypothetical protein